MGKSKRKEKNKKEKKEKFNNAERKEITIASTSETQSEDIIQDGQDGQHSESIPKELQKLHHSNTDDSTRIKKKTKTTKKKKNKEKSLHKALQLSTNETSAKSENPDMDTITSSSKNSQCPIAKDKAHLVDTFLDTLLKSDSRWANLFQFPSELQSIRQDISSFHILLNEMKSIISIQNEKQMITMKEMFNDQNRQINELKEQNIQLKETFYNLQQK